MSGTIIITEEGDNVCAKQAEERNKTIISWNCVPFTGWISEINNTQVDFNSNVNV